MSLKRLVQPVPILGGCLVLVALYFFGLLSYRALLLGYAEVGFFSIEPIAHHPTLLSQEYTGDSFTVTVFDDEFSLPISSLVPDTVYSSLNYITYDFRTTKGWVFRFFDIQHESEIVTSTYATWPFPVYYLYKPLFAPGTVPNTFENARDIYARQVDSATFFVSPYAAIHDICALSIRQAGLLSSVRTKVVTSSLDDYAVIGVRHSAVSEFLVYKNQRPTWRLMVFRTSESSPEFTERHLAHVLRSLGNDG